MKKNKFLYILGLIALSFIFTNCSKEEIEPDMVKNVCYESGYFHIVVTASGGSWVVADVPDWISVSPSSGSEGDTTVEISYDENTNSDERQATLVFGGKWRLKVIQAGKR